MDRLLHSIYPKKTMFLIQRTSPIALPEVMK